MMRDIHYKKKKQVLGFFSIFVLLSGLTGCFEEQEVEKEITRPVRAMQIPDGQTFAKQNFPGRARATQEVDLAFRVSGPLIEFPVDVGDTVKKGDVVARIDPRDYQTAVQAAQGRLDNARAALVRAENDYQRELRIRKQDPGATSQTAVDRKKEERDKAQANIKLFAAELNSAKDNLNYTYLKAPYEGNVVNKYVENYEDVQAKQPIVRILDDSQIEMVVNVPESLISLAPHVTDIQVIFDPFPDTIIPAQIKEIGREASSTTRTYPVTLIMKQPAEVKILPGMAGKASGTTPKELAKRNYGIEIPVSAVFTDEAGTQSYVWIINTETSTVSRQAVQIDKASDHGMLINSGLQAGEWIATAGVNYLREGQQVSILQQNME